MLRLQLFGSPSIKKVDVPVTNFKSSKIKALLFYLALTPGQHYRNHLASLFWSEFPEDKALTSLRFALWNLRQILGPSFLSTDRATVTFYPGDEIWIDVSEFLRIVEAIDPSTKMLAPETTPKLHHAAQLYQGDFLAGFELVATPLFEDWQQQQRYFLHQKAINLFTSLGAYYTAQRRLPEAMAATQRLLDLEPWQESAHRQMMLLLALAGRRGAALDHYRQFQQILAAELSVEPEIETTQLMERIRAGQLELEDEPALELAETRSIITPLFGRQVECAWLIERWEMSSRARSGLVLIRGEAGVGKTRLVEEVSRHIVAQGGLALQGRCFELSAPIPYQPIAESLRKSISRLERADLSLNQLWLIELAQLVPEIREKYGQLPPASPTTNRETNLYRLFEAVGHFLEAVSEQQPVLLFLDDLHWADTDTLDMLGYLVRRLVTSRLLIIGAYRPSEIPDQHHLANLQESLYGERLVEELKLLPLTKEAIEQIARTITSTTDAPRLSQFLYRLSEGNPFILFELLIELEEQGWLHRTSAGNLALQSIPSEQETVIPVGVRARIQRRVARLAKESQRLLSLAAVIGREFEAELLQAASGASLELVLDCLDDWLDRRLIKELIFDDQPDVPVEAPLYVSSCRYDFSHDLIRAVVYDDLSQTRRQILHSRVGTAIEQLYYNQSEQVVEWLAHHYHLGYESSKALVYLQRAGQQEQTVYALPLAMTHYQQALSHWNRLYRPIGLNTPLEAWRQRWDLLLSQAKVSHMLGHLEKQRQTLDTVAWEVAQWGDASDQLQIIIQQLVQLRKVIKQDHRRLLARKGLALARSLGDGLAESYLLQALGDCERDIANHPQALLHYEAALAKFSKLDQTHEAAFCLIHMGGTHLLNNRYAKTLACFKEAEQYAQTGKHQDALIWSLVSAAYTYCLLGHLEEAQTISQKALTLCHLIGFQPAMAAVLAVQGRINDIYLGNSKQAQEQYEQAWLISQEMGQTLRMIDIKVCLGHLYLGQADPAQALHYFMEAQKLSTDIVTSRTIEAKSYQALSLLLLGQVEEAACHSHAALTELAGWDYSVEAVQRLFLNHYRIMVAQNQLDEAQAALAAARDIVRTQANDLAAVPPTVTDNLALQTGFLTRVPWNRDIIGMEEISLIGKGVT